jgi:RNAse (barnase) inhibitor barstar
VTDKLEQRPELDWRVPGLYLARGDSASVAERAADLGLTAYLAEWGADRATTLTALAAALRFPAWFGHNLDALADCVSDLSWLPTDPALLVCSGSGRLAVGDRATYDAIVAILADETTASTGSAHPLTAVLASD